MGPEGVSFPVFEGAWEEDNVQMHSPVGRTETLQEEETDEAPPATAGAHACCVLAHLASLASKYMHLFVSPLQSKLYWKHSRCTTAHVQRHLPCTWLITYAYHHYCDYSFFLQGDAHSPALLESHTLVLRQIFISDSFLRRCTHTDMAGCQAVVWVLYRHR